MREKRKSIQVQLIQINVINFFLRDGKNLMQLDNFHIGDELDLLWEISEEIADNLDDRQWANFSFEITRTEHSPPHVFIPFVVVRRCHGASCGDRDLKYLELSIIVEAAIWQYEDLWKWIVMGVVPAWARD
jgi:hypothetical protein